MYMHTIRLYEVSSFNVAGCRVRRKVKAASGSPAATALRAIGKKGKTT